MDMECEVYSVQFCIFRHGFIKFLSDKEEPSTFCEDIKYESVAGFTVEVNHVRSSLKSLIAIQVIGFCWSHPMTESQTLKSMKKQLYALLLNC